MKPETKRIIAFDWAIKTLLREKSHFSILAGFLSELLSTDVKIQSLLESEGNKRHAKDKSNRVDVLAELGNDEKVIIEVQVERQWDFLSRMLYGVSKVVVEHIKEGEPYRKIPRIISINIVYFDLGEGEDYIYHGRTHFEGIHKKDILQLTDKEKEHYPPQVTNLSEVFPEYYVLKVSGFDLKIRNTLDEWMYALKKSEICSDFKAKGIKEAAEKLNFLNLSEEERRAYDRYMADTSLSVSLLESSFTDGLFEGREQGRAEGLEEGEVKGRLEEKKEMIRNLHKVAVPLDQIAMAANLSLEEAAFLLEHL